MLYVINVHPVYRKVFVSLSLQVELLYHIKHIPRYILNYIEGFLVSRHRENSSKKFAMRQQEILGQMVQ